MNPDPGPAGPSDNGDEEEVVWDSASTNLKTKIDLVQEILARLECALTAVTRKKNELELTYRTRVQAGSFNGESLVRFDRTLLTANEIIQVIGESLNQYCAFDNVLRTVEENRNIEENVVLLFPTLSKLDKIITHFQKDRISEWNAIKQKVEEFNGELNRVNNSNMVPVMSRLLQVKLSTSGSNTQCGSVLSESNISKVWPTAGKRPHPEDINIPPEKFLRLSCSKSDAAAAAAIQTNPLDLIKNLCQRQGQEVIEVVDYGVSEENRIICHINSSNIQNGDQDPNRNKNSHGLSNYGTSNTSASTQCCGFPNNPYLNYASNNSQFISTNVNNRYGSSTNSHLYNNNQLPVCSMQSQVGSSSNQPQVYNSQSVNYNNQPNFYNTSNNVFQVNNSQSQHFNNPTQPFNQLQRCNNQSFNVDQSPSFNINQSQSFNVNQSQSFNVNQSQTFNNNQPQPFNNNQPQSFNNQSRSFNQSQSFNNQFQSFNNNQNQSFLNHPQDYSNQSHLYNNQSLSFNSQSQLYNNQPKNNSWPQVQVYGNSNLPQVSYSNDSNQPGVNNFQSYSNISQASTSSYYSQSVQSNIGTTVPSATGPSATWYNPAEKYPQRDLNRHATNYDISREIRPNADAVVENVISPTTAQIPNPNTSLYESGIERTPLISNLRNLLLTRNSLNPAVEDEKLESNSIANILRPSVIQKSPRKAFSPDSNQTTFDVAKSSLFKEIQELIGVTSLDINGSSLSNPMSEKLPEVITIEDEDSFKKLNLKKTLAEGIQQWGLSIPKPFQMEGIKSLMEGKDIVVQCPHAGGKTTLAIIAVVQSVNEKSFASQAIILSASKEDSLYIHERMLSLGALTKISPICVDNTSSNEYRSTKDCGQVIVGMPENVLSFLKKHNFRTETVLSLIIDSADVLLENGGVQDVMKILYVLNGDTQVSMMVRQKTETVVAFSKRLRNPIDIEVPPIEETKEDAPIGTGSSPPMTPTSSNASDSTVEIPGPNSCSPPSELVIVRPKYIFKVKSILKHFSVVEVSAELPNGEEIELELKDECSEGNDENQLDPEEDPLALTEPTECRDPEDELDPIELARRLKSQTLLQKNPNFYMAFPEDIQETLASVLPKNVTVNEERKPSQCTTIARKVSCASDHTGNGLLMDREEFLRKKHYYVILEEEDAKVETLSLFNMEQSRAIIFCHNCEKAEWLSTKLRQKSMFPQVLHKYTSKKDRDTILKTFEMEVCRVLISTDNVLTDVSTCGVPLVINYDMPAIPVNYFWRSRFATQNSVDSSRRAIMVVSFLQESNLRLIHHIQKTYGVKILPMMEDRSPSRASSVCSTVEVDCESPD